MGRLKLAFPKWQTIGTNNVCLDLISDGYKVPFLSLPPISVNGNNRSARENNDFVASEITKLLNKECISKVDAIPHVVNPLTVAYGKTGKPRLVLDCRVINQCLFKYKFCMEDMSCARNMFKQGDYLCTFDLRSAYHHISINEFHRIYLGFAHDEGSVKNYYNFNVLPFGISTAGYIFTKLLRNVINHWRSQGHKIILFLDDGILGADSYENCQNLAKQIKQDLLDLGFLLAEEKCDWEPKQVVSWLGHVFDTSKAELHITEDRVKKALTFISNLINEISEEKVWVHVKNLASAIGQFQSMRHVLGSRVDIMTKWSHMCVNTRTSWFYYVKTNVQVSNESIGVML